MADFDSSLPVRTQNNGDVVAFIADATTPSQLAAVDSHGSQQNVIKDASGNAIGSQLIASTYWFQVVTPGNGPAQPGTASAFSVLAGGIYNATPPTLTDGQQASLQLDANGRLLVDANIINTNDTNYGVVGSNTLRTAAQIGNATGAADFNWGAVGAQTLRVASEIGNATGAADFNWGTVGAQTIRTAAEIGNASGLADFGAGATSAQTLRVVANQGAPNTLANAWPVLPTDGTNSQSYTAAGEAKVTVTEPLPAGTNLIGAVNVDIGGSPVSATNPLPVTVEDAPGTHINNYKDAAAIASGASDNHDYTVSAGKTLHLLQVESAGSGKAKMQLQIETGVATGVFNTVFVQFNSTADSNMSIHLDSDILVAAGVRVRLVMSNRDLVSQDLYSTICGYEV